VLDIVAHQNIWLSHVSDILDSEYLPTVFHILDHVKTKALSELNHFKNSQIGNGFRTLLLT
jgi:hypothetical protein